MSNIYANGETVTFREARKIILEGNQNDIRYRTL